ncbi:MAG: GntR family transcriptional regulator [Clostridiaceae bacterium]|nr:GntR family transcriptional regulator [Clostridiaceae bacterium]
MKSGRRSRDEAMEKVESYIIKNKLEPHAKLPSEREMCDMWGFNRTTLRFAIKRLIIEGKIYQIKGSGTYVAEPKIIRSLQDLKSLSEFAKDNELKLTSEVISFELIEGYKQITQKLHLTLGQKVYVLTRCRFVQEEPVAIEVSFLSYDRFKGLDKYDFSKESLYSIIENEYNVSISRGDENIGISYATDYEAKLLKIEEKQAVFYVSGIIYDKEDVPVEYMKSIIRPDKMGFSSILKREEG